MNDVLHFLNSIHPLSPDLTEHLTTILKYRVVLKKQYLLHAGHTCRTLCFMSKGLMRSYYNIGDQEVCSCFMTEGDVIIAVESFFFQRESQEAIQALEDCELYSIEHGQLEAIYRRFPEFNFISRVLLQKYYTLSEQRLHTLRLLRAWERYAFLLQQQGELVLRVPAKYLASYLGITEQHLSAVKAKQLYAQHAA